MMGRSKGGHVVHVPSEITIAVNVEALGIDQLSIGERLQLFDLIWDSLPEHVDPADVPAWHLAEIANRRAEADENPGIGKPWQQVLGELGAKS